MIVQVKSTSSECLALIALTFQGGLTTAIFSFVKYTEHLKTLACEVNNIPNALPLKLIAVLKLLFQNEWEKAYLESQLRSDQYMEAQILKAKTDKEILYRKMCVAFAIFTVFSHRHFAANRSK